MEQSILVLSKFSAWNTCCIWQKTKQYKTKTNPTLQCALHGLPFPVFQMNWQQDLLIYWFLNLNAIGLATEELG